MPAPLLPGQAGEARPPQPSGSPVRGQRDASETRGLGGPEGFVRHARRAHLAPLGVGSPRASKYGPGPAEDAPRGPRRPLVQVRPAGSEAGAPGAPKPRRLFTAGQQPQAQTPRARGFRLFPRSMGSGAPGGRGGQRAVAAMPQCRWGGPAAPAPGSAQPANGSRRFRGSSALRLPNRRGETYCMGTRTLARPPQRGRDL